MPRNGRKFLAAGILAGGLLSACASARPSDGAAAAGAQAAAVPGKPPAPAVARTGREVDLERDMRGLWTAQAAWTRDYIVASVAGAGDATEAGKRLLRNQQDISDAIVPYYGEAGGRRLAELLTGHVRIAFEVVEAAGKGDAAKLEDAQGRWRCSAAEIGALLASANPHWKREQVEAMLNEQMVLTTNEATLRIQKKWAEDVANHDRILQQAMVMADCLTNGIVKQFPDRFR